MGLQKGWFKLHSEHSMHRTVKGKTVIFLLIVTNLVYFYMLFVSIPRVQGFSDGMKIPDMMPIGYEPGYILALFEKLGEQGRNAYLYQQIPVDLFYPLLFGITYSLIILYLLQKLQKLDRESLYLCLLPLMGGFFDYLENFGIIHILRTFPDTSISSIKISAFFTVFKSMLSTISFTVIIILLVMLIHQKLIAAK